MDVWVCLFCICVVLCVGSGLATAWSPSKKSYRLCIRLRNWKAAKAQQRAVEPRMNECIVIIRTVAWFVSSRFELRDCLCLRDFTFLGWFTIFWDVKPCSFIDGYHCFGGIEEQKLVVGPFPACRFMVLSPDVGMCPYFSSSVMPFTVLSFCLFSEKSVVRSCRK
jgi:hypothetical protein